MREILHPVRRLAATLLLPWFRLELPGWQRVSSWVGLPIKNQAQWATTPPRIVTGKLHGMRMRLHMQDWCERLTYFLGRYYELPVELLIRALARPGETFIDVGGNIGMTTLMGAACVGPAGFVHTFEPNPDMVTRIRDVVLLNHLNNVVIYPMGLSDEPAKLRLTTVAEANGWSSFGNVPRDPSLHYREVDAQVVPADSVIPADIAGPITIKVDAEGFEYRVLLGMASLISRSHPALITELDPKLLLMAGTNAQALFDKMHAWGYVGYEVTVARIRPFLRLELLEITAPHGNAKNVAWIHPDSVFQERVQSAVSRRAG